MEVNYLISLITVIVTMLLGQVSKKIKWVGTKLIPIQNLLIGLIVAIIEWIITKDFSLAIATSGLLAGGGYDLVHNLTKIQEIIETDTLDSYPDDLGADTNE